MGLLPLEHARSRLLEGVRPGGTARAVVTAALGKVLAEDVIARSPLPPFDQSAMDGYALDSRDLGGEAPFQLEVQGESRSGGAWPGPLDRGTACRIFTGAVLPGGADTVIMQEEVERSGNRIGFARRPASFEYVRRAGEDLAAGELGLRAGTRLGPAQLALLAALDRTEIEVFTAPRVAVFSTGDELRQPGEPARPGSIVDTNRLLVSQLVESVGAEVGRTGCLPDDRAVTSAALDRALAESRVVLTIGGVSVGDYDLVQAAARDAGVEIGFWRVAMKPGKPLLVGRRGSTLLLGLPGNPLSACLCFAVLVAPLLRTLQGDRAPGELLAEPLRQRASGSVSALAWAEGFVEVEPEVRCVPAGTRLPLLRLSDV